MKKIIYILIAGSLFLVSCSDFLDRSPNGSVNNEQLTNERGLSMLISGMYAAMYHDSYFEAPLSNYAYGDVMGGDANKGSTFNDQSPFTNIETYAITTDNSYFNQKWNRTYDGVSRANDVLNFAEKMKEEAFMQATGVSKDVYTETVAQCLFFRGFWHFEAVKNFGAAVPYVDLEAVLENYPNPIVSNVDESGNYIYIWDNIIKDLEFAYNNLPDYWPGESGKANKWAAAAYLAKVKMYQSSPYNGTNGTQNKWKEVKSLIEDIMANGKDGQGNAFKLAKTYEELWVAGESDWTGESVFDLQMTIVGSEDRLSSINGAPHIAPPGGMGTEGWGFYQPSNDLVNAYIVDDEGLPMLDKSYQKLPPLTTAGATSNFPITDLDTYTDPRLDISVGRFHVPFWDWAVPTGIDGWVRDLGNGGFYFNKKNQPKKADKEQGLSHPQRTSSTAKNFHLIRYADVLLWYAEALIETGDHAKARDYINQVRSRASNSYVKAVDPNTMIESTSSYILDDKISGTTAPNAAGNYRIGLYPASQFASKEKALQALRFERRVELAMEGQRWYDLARWGIISEELTDYINFEKQFLKKYDASKYNEKWVTLPIPNHQIVTMEGILVQNENWK